MQTKGSIPSNVMMGEENLPSLGIEAADGGAVFTNIRSKNMKLPKRLVAAMRMFIPDASTVQKYIHMFVKFYTH